MSTREEKKGRVQFTIEDLGILLSLLWEDLKGQTPGGAGAWSRTKLYYKLTRALIRLTGKNQPLDEVRHEPG